MDRGLNPFLVSRILRVDFRVPENSQLWEQVELKVYEGGDSSDADEPDRRASVGRLDNHVVQHLKVSRTYDQEDPQNAMLQEYLAATLG